MGAVELYTYLPHDLRRAFQAPSSCTGGFTNVEVFRGARQEFVAVCGDDERTTRKAAVKNDQSAHVWCRLLSSVSPCVSAITGEEEHSFDNGSGNGPGELLPVPKSNPG